MDQQSSNEQQAGAGDAVPQMNPLDMPQLNNDFMSADAMAGLMQGQPFMPDPSMAGMPMPDAQLLMPLIMSNGSTEAPLQSTGISADDIALYDRQIRLWGMAAQAKIQSANILLITIKALGNEIAKNLVLAGVGSLTILDDSVVTESDLGAQFFLSEEDSGIIGQNRAQVACPAIQKLNPRVQVRADAEGVKSKGPSYFGSFNVVIATDIDPDSFNLINTATRLNGRKFYAASTHGMYGFIFSDLIEHDYVIEREVGNVATQCKEETRTRSIINVQTKKEGTKNMESVTKRELYSTWFLASDIAVLPGEYAKSKRRLKAVSPALSCLRALWEFMQTKGGRVPSNKDDLKMFTQMATQKHKALGLPGETLSAEFLRTFLQNLGSEIAPVTAILGGQLAQDVINVLGQKEQPIQNMVIFDGTSMEALLYPLHPEGPLGFLQLTLAGNDSMLGNGAAGGGDLMMGSGMGIGFDPNAMGGLPMPDAGFPMGGGMVPHDMALGGLPDQPLNNTNQPHAQPPSEKKNGDNAGQVPDAASSYTKQGLDSAPANPPTSDATTVPTAEKEKETASEDQ